MGSRPSFATARTLVILLPAAVAGPLVGGLSPHSAFAQAPSSLTISGTVQGQLAPGVLQPLDLALANSHPFALSVTGLVVTVGGISAPNADAGHPCTVDDFVVRQLDTPTPFSLNAGTESRLSSLGFTDAQLPAVGILDRPVNQDGCREASVSLGYTATIESAEGPAAAPAQPAVEPAQPSTEPTSSASNPAPATAEPAASAAESASPAPDAAAATVPSARPSTAARSASAPPTASTAAPTAAPQAQAPPINPGTQVSGRISGSADHRSRFAMLVDRILETVRTVAPAVIRGVRLPIGLLLAVLIFLLVQNWIDRRDPKLALAPSYADPDLPFDYRSPNPAKALS